VHGRCQDCWAGEIVSRKLPNGTLHVGCTEGCATAILGVAGDMDNALARLLRVFVKGADEETE